jgi:hypothetical protein
VSGSLTITATARDWAVLKQAHSSLVLFKQHSGDVAATIIGRIIYDGLLEAFRENATPPLGDLSASELGVETNVTVRLDRDLFRGLMFSLEIVHDMIASPLTANILNDKSRENVDQAYVSFKAEAVLAGF